MEGVCCRALAVCCRPSLALGREAGGPTVTSTHHCTTSQAVRRGGGDVFPVLPAPGVADGVREAWQPTRALQQATGQQCLEQTPTQCTSKACTVSLHGLPQSWRAGRRAPGPRRHHCRSGSVGYQGIGDVEAISLPVCGCMYTCKCEARWAPSG
jgi:hypothetical protein